MTTDTIKALRDALTQCRRELYGYMSIECADKGTEDAVELADKALALTADASEDAPQAGWVDEFGNVFPLGAYSANGKPNYHDAHKRGWMPLYRHAARPAPVAATPAPTEGWLIEWIAMEGKGRKVSSHNCVADYRAMHDGVTVCELVRRPAASLAAAPAAPGKQATRPAAENESNQVLASAQPSNDQQQQAAPAPGTQEMLALHNDLNGVYGNTTKAIADHLWTCGYRKESAPAAPIAEVTEAYMTSDKRMLLFPEQIDQIPDDPRTLIELYAKAKPIDHAKSEPVDQTEECTLCNGMGYLDGAGSTCPHCDGKGKEPVAHDKLAEGASRYLTIVFKVPAVDGVDSPVALLRRNDWTASSWSHAMNDRDDAREELAAYKAGQQAGAVQEQQETAGVAETGRSDTKRQAGAVDGEGI